jgi:carbonic anhydrase
MLNRYAMLFAALCSMAAMATPSNASERAATPHWTYAGSDGPSHWGALGKKDIACSEGLQQSPIALDPAQAVPHGEEFQIRYRPSKADLVNNGHTVEADIQGGGDIVTFDGEDYELKQFHFHTPSEHTLDGKRYPLEIHFVNTTDAGRVTVAAVLVEEGAENVAVAELFGNLPMPGEHIKLRNAVDLSSVLPNDRHALVYTGSLTTPPCTQGVHWIVLRQPVRMSAAQIDAFGHLFPDNHRPLQERHGREIDAE